MIAIEQTVTVDAPLASVHTRWLEVDRFPEFMEGVAEVVRLGEARLSWRGDFAGTPVRWEGEIMVHIPSQRISWRTYAGFDSSGAVTFDQVNGSATRVTLGFIFDPQALPGEDATVTAFLQARLARDLQRFKELIEAPNLPPP